MMPVSPEVDKNPVALRTPALPHRAVSSAPSPNVAATRAKEAPVTRPREHLLANLESLYREAYARAQAAGDEREASRLDFGYRRDQLYLEAVLDVRDALLGLRAAPAEGQQQKGDKSVIDTIGGLRSLTRFPFGR